MDPNLSAVLGVFMRWLHISSAITILGGFIYARYAIAPALALLPGSEGSAFANRAIAGFRPVLYTALGAVLVSGLYNYLTKPFYPAHYHAVIGVKFLLVLHVFAVSVLYTIPGSGSGGANRLRRLNWLVISGLLIVLISADLRSMTMNAMFLR